MNVTGIKASPCILRGVNEIKDVTNKHGRDLRHAVGTDFAKTKKPMYAIYVCTIKPIKITISSKSAKNLDVSGGGYEQKETCLPVRFLLVQIVVFAAMGIIVQPVAVWAPL